MAETEEYPATSQQGVDRLMYDLFYLTDVLVRKSHTTETDIILKSNHNWSIS